MVLGRATVRVASAVVLMPQALQLPRRHMVRAEEAEEVTTRPHMTLPVLGASGVQLGQDGQAVSPQIMALRSVSLLVRVASEPSPVIVAVKVLSGMHG